MCAENPVSLVRQSARRTRALPRLSIEQYRQLVAMAVEPHRTMLLLAGCLGLRIGEILGLQWGDVDVATGAVTVRRDIYQGHVDEPKTAHSLRTIPLPAPLLDSLATWRQAADYHADAEFVFAGASGAPRWADALREKVLRPLGRQIGIERLGWHAFRHLFASALNVGGSDAQTNQELMGHADRRTTEQYMYAFADRKRAAMAGVAGLLI